MKEFFKKRLRQFARSDSAYGILSHGANEAANVLLHGHPAQLYGGTMAQGDSPPEVDATKTDAPQVDPSPAQESQQPEKPSAIQKLREAQQQSKLEAPQDKSKGMER